jgi:hypothetical protein
MAASETESDTVQVDGHETRSAVTEVEEARRSPPAGEKDPPADDAVADPNLVDWNGPSDPENPRNWSKACKMLNIMLVSLSVLYSYVWTNPFPVCANRLITQWGKSNTDAGVNAETSPRPCSPRVPRP